MSFLRVFLNCYNLVQRPRVLQDETCGDRSRDFKLLCLCVSFPSLSCLSVVLMHIRLFMAMFPTFYYKQLPGARAVVVKGNQAECWKFVYLHMFACLLNSTLQGFCASGGRGFKTADRPSNTFSITGPLSEHVSVC